MPCVRVYSTLMEKTRDKFNLKRVKMAFATVLALVALAGVLQVALAVLSLADAGVMPDAEAGSDGAAMDKGLLCDIVLDGGAVSADTVDALAVEKRDFTSHVEFIDQYEVLPAGCEIMSLTVVLRSMGYDVDPLDLADNYVDMSGVFPTGFSGSPYTNGGGLPPCIVAAGEAWLGEHAEGYHAHDTTGSPFDALAALVEGGYPVSIWVTEGMVAPSNVEPSGDYLWYWPEHCITVYGAEGDRVLVCDTIYGMAEYSRAEFVEIYEAYGSMSTAILPV